MASSNRGKALVTGASGFVGSRLVQRLAGEGVEVVALDLLPPRRVIEGVDYRPVDVRDSIAPETAKGVDVIYNLAAIHRTPGHPDQDYYDTNIRGALNVTALAEANEVDRIVFTSSISVYGPTEAQVSERSPTAPVSAYGRSKLIAEAVHGHWQGRGSGRRLVTVRPGVVFGPGEGGNYTHLARALAGGYFVYPGRRDTIKSGGYVDDLIGALDFALAQADPVILFNFAYPDQSTTRDIVETFGRVTGKAARPLAVPTGLMLTAAALFEIANHLGIRNPVHRQRILKLVQSTRVAPGWLIARGFRFTHTLETALAAWKAETDGRFI